MVPGKRRTAFGALRALPELGARDFLDGRQERRKRVRLIRRRELRARDCPSGERLVAAPRGTHCREGGARDKSGRAGHPTAVRGSGRHSQRLPLDIRDCRLRGNKDCRGWLCSGFCHRVCR